MFAQKFGQIIIYACVAIFGSWWSQWVMMAVSYCHSCLRWFFGTLWVTLIGLWTFLFFSCWCSWNWHTSCVQSVTVEFFSAISYTCLVQYFSSMQSWICFLMCLNLKAFFLSCSEFSIEVPFCIFSISVWVPWIAGSTGHIRHAKIAKVRYLIKSAGCNDRQLLPFFMNIIMFMYFWVIHCYECTHSCQVWFGLARTGTTVPVVYLKSLCGVSFYTALNVVSIRI